MLSACAAFVGTHAKAIRKAGSGASLRMMIALHDAAQPLMLYGFGKYWAMVPGRKLVGVVGVVAARDDNGKIGCMRRIAWNVSRPLMPGMVRSSKITGYPGAVFRHLRRLPLRLPPYGPCSRTRNRPARFGADNPSSSTTSRALHGSVVSSGVAVEEVVC